MGLNASDAVMLDVMLRNDEKRQALIDLLDDNPHAIEDILSGDTEAVAFTVQGRLTSQEVELVGKIAESDELIANVLDQACDRATQRDRASGIGF